MLAAFSCSASAQTAASSVPAQTEQKTASQPLLRNTFNHLKTGFPLRAAHLSVACETCHIGGTFKGTPRDCAGCHSTGQRIAATPKTQDHIPTTKGCDACHGNGASFLTAVMDHTGLTEPCAVCHNGSYSTIVKSVPQDYLHFQNSNLACDSCHKNTFTFLGSRFDHANTVSDCANCHNNVTAPGLPSNHIPTPTPAVCEQCHTPALTPGWPNPTVFLGALFDHNASGYTVGSHTCSTCHASSIGVKAKIAGHVSTTLSCDYCHTSTISFAAPNWTMQHTTNNNTTGCANCHTGATVGATVVMGKPTYHIATTAACENCHTDTSPGGFTSWTMTHSVVTATGCNTCHKTGGDTTLGTTTVKGEPAPPTHIPNSPACENCHADTSPGGFTAWTMNHNAISPTLSCATCHGSSASVPASVLKQPPMSAQGSFGATSHIYYGSGDCNQCHKSTSTFLGWLASDVHIAVAGSVPCASCHSIAGATNEAPFLDALIMQYPVAPLTPHSTYTSIATSTSDCSACHNTSTFLGATGGHDMSAAGVAAAAGNCTSCHKTGGTGKVFTTGPHIPSSAPGASLPVGAAGQCDKCHTDAYTSLSFLTETMNHTSGYPSSTRCDACHGGTTYASEGVKNTTATTHIAFPVGTDCVACHTSTTSFAAWLPATVHTAVGAGTGAYTCASCHDNTHSYTGVVVKPTLASAHISYNSPGVDCGTSSCHTSLTAFTSWTMGTTGHANVATAVPLCATCHDNGVALPASVVKKPATGAPAGHIPYIGGTACSSCHGNGDVSFTTWTMGTTGHPFASGTCQSCHATGTTFYDVSLVTYPVGHDATATALTGFVFTTPTTTASDCSQCHNTTTFKTTAGLHTTAPSLAAGTCASGTCHNSGGTGRVFTASHIPSSTPGAVINKGAAGQCDNCHTGSYSSFSFVGATMNHSAGSGYSSSTAPQCDSCHGGTTYASEGVKNTTATTHITIPAGVYCNACHTSTTTFTAWTASTVHTVVGAGTAPYTCAACHDNTHSYTGVVIKPNTATTHITYNGGVDCGTSSCHTSLTSFLTWSMGSAGHTNVSVACSTCHDTAASVPIGVVKMPTKATNVMGGGGATSHIYYAAGECSQCHKTTTTFTGWATSDVHTAVGGTGSTCSTCHSPTGATFYDVTLVSFPAVHPYASNNSNCATCHSLTTFLGATGGHSAPSAPGICASSGCHSAGGAGKVFTTPTHIPSSAPGATIAGPTAGQCDSCHTSSYASMSFLTETMNHTSGYPSGTRCDACHGGTTYASEGVKNTTATSHISLAGLPGGADCGACHTSTTSFAAPNWTASTVHTVVGAGTAPYTCAACHNNNGYSGVLNIPSSHIPIAGAACNSSGCHSSTTSPGGFTTWAMGATGHTSAGVTTTM